MASGHAAMKRSPHAAQDLPQPQQGPRRHGNPSTAANLPEEGSGSLRVAYLGLARSAALKFHRSLPLPVHTRAPARFASYLAGSQVVRRLRFRSRRFGTLAPECATPGGPLVLERQEHEPPLILASPSDSV